MTMRAKNENDDHILFKKSIFGVFSFNFDLDSIIFIPKTTKVISKILQCGDQLTKTTS